MTLNPDTYNPPPEPDTRPERVTEWRINRNWIRAGDMVKVRPPHGASFVAKFIAVVWPADGPCHVDVYGGARGRAKFRSVTPDSISRMDQTAYERKQ